MPSLSVLHETLLHYTVFHQVESNMLKLVSILVVGMAASQAYHGYRNLRFLVTANDCNRFGNDWK